MNSAVGMDHARRVEADLQRMAARVTALERLQSRYSLQVVDELPASPYEGQEVAYQTAAMEADSVVWRFRYRELDADGGTNANTYKWEFIGGTAWIREVSTAENTASSSAVDLTTVGPSFDSELPSGEYVLRASITIANATASVTRGVMYLDNNGSDTSLRSGTLHASNYYLSLSSELAATITESTTVKLQYASTAATSVAFSARKLSVTPVAIG